MTASVIPMPTLHPLVARHGTTPEQLRAMVRDLALWMHEHGVEHVALAREPGTAKFVVSVDGSAL